MFGIRPQDDLTRRKTRTLKRCVIYYLREQNQLLQNVVKCCTLLNRLCAWTHMIPLFTPPMSVGVFFISEPGFQNLDLPFCQNRRISTSDPHSQIYNGRHSTFRTPHSNMPLSQTVESLNKSGRKRSLRSLLLTNLVIGTLTVVGFYLSLLATSRPVSSTDMAEVDRAIDLLATKGFDREVFLLRHTVTYRSTDHWLNRMIFKENAFAATNFPFQMITLYPDFYQKATDDTERAMVLLHEAQHLQGADEQHAYAYVWKNRARLGWTRNLYGSTPTYMDVAGQTRENAPELFVCTLKTGNDCTEDLRTTAQNAQTALLR